MKQSGSLWLGLGSGNAPFRSVTESVTLTHITRYRFWLVHNHPVDSVCRNLWPENIAPEAVKIVCWVTAHDMNQWRLQDFPSEGANPKGGCANLLFRVFFTEKAMNMKIKLDWRPLLPLPDPPVRNMYWNSRGNKTTLVERDCILNRKELRISLI